MREIELKSKQASAVLSVAPKDLQNLVQFGLVKPRLRRQVAVSFKLEKHYSFRPLQSVTRARCGAYRRGVGSKRTTVDSASRGAP